MNTTRRDAEQTRRKKRGEDGVIGRRLGVASSMLDFDNFVYRWINDIPARMFAKTKEDDWDVVMNDGVKEDASDMGNAVSQVVGTKPDGSALVAYLCRKRRTFYDEDQKEKSNALDKQLEQLRRGMSRDGDAQADYIPQSGIRMG